MSENSEDKKVEENTGTAHPVDEENLNDEAESTDESSHPDNSEATDSSEDPAAKLAQLEKDHLYLRAEMENIKRQSIKERSQLLKFGAERLARDLLETLDVFKSALDSEVNEENFKEFVNGIQMTKDSLKTALEKHGIKEVECVGKPFDPNTQEALSSEFKEGVPEGHVTQVFKAPFVYHDKLLRPGQVIVSRAKSE